MRSLLIAFAGFCAMHPAVADDLAQLEQQAFNAAAAAVADCVVQIRTVGGLDQLDDQVLAQGPTTGLILTADGYIVSSAINFAQQPASVLVRLPGGEQRPAEIIGRDANRMLVLLKVEVDEALPTPTLAPLAEVHVGDWAVAAGRTYSADKLNVSVGVVSALNRMHGRALQTDASASAANYGGPLVDLQGRVLGVLVPMAPQTGGSSETNELAGAEFYDSGIAFAVPLEDILAVLERWIAAGDLNRGLLGVGLAEGSPHSTPPRITAVWPRSPAAEAGWQVGDVIVAVDGAPVESQTQLRFRTATRYAGDELAVTLRRGKGDPAEEIETKLTLAADLEAFRHAFLGVLPQRGVAEGVIIRAAWPGSPADKAGLEQGDVVTKLGDKTIDSLDDAFAAMSGAFPGDELAVVVRRGEETLERTVELAELPTEALSAADLPTAAGDETANDDDDQDAAPPELAELRLADFPQPARYFAPLEDGASPGLLILLGAGSEDASKGLAAAWRDACTRDRLVLLLPAPGDAKGWSTDDLEFLGRLIPAAISRLGVDPRRAVIAGEGRAGQLAYALAFQGRKWIRGVAVVDSPLPRTLKLPQNSPNQRLAVLSVETQNEPLALLIHRDLAKLADAGYPPTQITRRSAESKNGELDAVTRATLVRWIDGLDRF